MAEQATDQRERVEVAEGDEPPAANEDTTPPLTLKQRMAAIRRHCADIGKSDITMHSQDRSKSWTIKGHTFEAVLSEIRPLFERFGVDMTPQLVERTYNGNRCDVLVDFTFERTDDSDESQVIRWGGAGTDNGDKAFAKAGTNALKEMLKKRFLVTDREDAKEEEEKVEHQTDESLSRAALEAEKEKARKALVVSLNGLKVALEAAKSDEDVTRLEREYRDALTSPDLPSVTRTFFAELIAKCRAKFAKPGVDA